MGRKGPDCCGSATARVAGCCKCGNELSGSIYRVTANRLVSKKGLSFKELVKKVPSSI